MILSAKLNFTLRFRTLTSFINWTQTCGWLEIFYYLLSDGGLFVFFYFSIFNSPYHIYPDSINRSISFYGASFFFDSNGREWEMGKKTDAMLRVAFCWSGKRCCRLNCMNLIWLMVSVGFEICVAFFLCAVNNFNKDISMVIKCKMANFWIARSEKRTEKNRKKWKMALGQEKNYSLQNKEQS